MYGLLRPKGSERGTEEELRRLVKVPLLVLDDLGSAKASEWTEEVTYRLINERYNACRPTLYTSNLPPARTLTTTAGRSAPTSPARSVSGSCPGCPRTPASSP
ncbi:hypothetical protein [Streptomyces microflavus]|uniref:hypothetical protein n=1 Tax=Streptomyces microflavus TaxID=1919 RepID=UPI003B21033C